MTVPVDAEASYSFVSTGAATYDIPLRIRDAGDIIVIYSDATADPAGYSVSAIDQDTPTFTINFSVVPAAAITVMILQSFPIAREVDYNPGQILTADSFNNMLDNLTIMQLDVEAMFDKISFRFNENEIINITDAMTEIPVPPAAAKQVLLWNTDAWEWKTIDAGGSAAELQLELASASSATDSGAHMVAYWNGTAAETIQEVLDGYKTTFDATNITATTFNNQTTMRVGDAWTMYNSAANVELMAWDDASGVLSIGEAAMSHINLVTPSVDLAADQTWTCGGNWTLVGSHAANLLEWSTTNSFTVGSSSTPTFFETPPDNLEWDNSTLTPAATTTDPIIATRGWSLNQLQAVVAASPTYADFVTNVAAL
tara:strand:- start:2198 stop:3307 length:1110 start_codon:yes stop_codon:yes gene_type:complete